MRIVAGKFKGKKLIDSIHLKELRPTSDRNREALFNILFSAKFIKEINFDIVGANVLDICCGTGAVAFEALSRGAKSAFLVDKNMAHLEIAKKNAQILGIESDVKFLLCDAISLQESNVDYDLIYIDPPYSYNVSEVIKNLLEKKLAKKKSLIVVETSEENFAQESLKLLDRRKYGKTYFSFFTTLPLFRA